METMLGNRFRRPARTPCMRWFSVVVGCMVTVGLNACATAIPSKFISQAEPGVTLTMLSSHPDAYRGKVVILGGTVVARREEGGRIWLFVENRPLDADYVPHLPPSVKDPEAGEYWIMVSPEGLPKTSRNWSRLTVIGRVSDERPAQHARGTGREPVLAALYLRGWGHGWDYGVDEATWEDIQSPNAILSTPLRVKP